MNIIIIAGLLLCLAVITFQDIKNREIHIVLPILIFVLSFLLSGNNTKEHLLAILQNTAFFLLILGILTLYMSVKNKSFLNPFQNYFGLGDLLFFIAITPLFIIRNYIVYFIASMLFAILLQLILQKKMKHSTVPLAGFASLLLILFIIKDLLPGFEHFTTICQQ